MPPSSGSPCRRNQHRREVSVAPILWGHARSAGGSASFVGKGVLISGRRLQVCLVLRVIGSEMGALLVASVSVRALQIIIAAAMFTAAVICWYLTGRGNDQRLVETSFGRQHPPDPHESFSFKNGSQFVAEHGSVGGNAVLSLPSRRSIASYV